MSPRRRALARVRSWYDSLPNEGKPEWEDVEFFINLGVKDAPTFDKLDWKNALSLTPRISELLSHAKAEPADTGIERALQDVESEGPFEATYVHAAVDGEEIELLADTRRHESTVNPDAMSSRERDLRAYVAAHMANEVNSPWNEEWIKAVLTDPTTVLKNLSTSVARQHSSSLQEILGLTERAPADASEYAGLGMEDFSQNPDAREHHQAPERVSVSIRDDGTVQLSWPAHPSHLAVFYFVFTGSDSGEPLLFGGELLASTNLNQAVDAAPVFFGGLRHFSVWAYGGTSVDEMKSAAPQLWARGVAVENVQNVKITSSGDDVSGRWESPENASYIEVYRLDNPSRVPIQRLPEPTYLQSGGADDRNLNGFVDRDLAGGSYEYRVYTVADFNGNRIRSVPYREIVEVSVPVPQVTELQVDVVEDPQLRFDISWLTPAGSNLEIQIHLSGKPSLPGSEGKELDEDALARAGFSEATRQNYPPEDKTDGRQGLSLDWPENLDRAYVTVVTRLGDFYKIGATEVRTNAGAVTAARIVERVDEQKIIFRWPSGADSVEIRQGPNDGSAPDLNWKLLQNVFVKEYQNSGGIHLERNLPSEGCQIAIQGVAFHEGLRTEGEQTTVQYPGLVRMKYQVHSPGRSSGGKKRRWAKKLLGSDLHQVQVTSDMAGEYTFVLVREAQRLPLHHRDGNEVRRRTALLERDVSFVLWNDLSIGRELSGYVRLFVEPSGEGFQMPALLDPPADALTWVGQ